MLSLVVGHLDLATQLRKGKKMTVSELVNAGLATDLLEQKLRELFTTDANLISKIEKTLESVEVNKREIMRELLIENYICDLVLASHIREAGF